MSQKFWTMFINWPVVRKVKNDVLLFDDLHFQLLTGHVHARGSWMMVFAHVPACAAYARGAYWNTEKNKLICSPLKRCENPFRV